MGFDGCEASSLASRVAPALRAFSAVAFFKPDT